VTEAACGDLVFIRSSSSDLGTRSEASFYPLCAHIAFKSRYRPCREPVSAGEGKHGAEGVKIYNVSAGNQCMDVALGVNITRKAWDCVWMYSSSRFEYTVCI